MQVRLKTFDELVKLGMKLYPDYGPGWYRLQTEYVAIISPQMLEDLGTVVEVRPVSPVLSVSPVLYVYKERSGLEWIITADCFVVSKNKWNISYANKT